MSTDKLNQPELVRAIGRWDLVAITINGIIGAGIFGLPSTVAKLVGAASPLAYIICAFIVALIVLCFAEASSLFAGTGGPYIYARAAFGNLIGFEIGWMLYLARVTAFAANCNQFVLYLSYFHPAASAGWERALVVTLFTAVLAFVNVCGVRQAAWVINLFTVGKLVPLTIFILAGLFFIDSRNFAGAQLNQAQLGKSLLVLIYAFTGFEYAVIPAGEATNPKRDMPHALLIGIGVVTVFYILIQIVCVGTMPDLAQAKKPLAEASERFLGPIGGSMMALGAMLSITGNLSSLTLAAPRLTYAFAEDRNLPSFLALVHQRYRTPSVSIVIFAVLAWALTLIGTFDWLVTLSAIARTITFAATCLSVPVLRKKMPDAQERFALPGGLIIPIVATSLSIWLLSHSSLADMKLAWYAALFGTLLFAATRYYSSRKEQSPSRRFGKI